MFHSNFFFLFSDKFCTFPLLTIQDEDIACMMHSWIYSGLLQGCMTLYTGE